jgi:hypothetical protein
MLMIRSLRSGPSALLKTTVMTVLLGCAAAAGAQTPDVSAKHASAPVPATPPNSEASEVGYHDLICKPNGSEDSFDCKDEATPAKIVPIPSEWVGPRPQDTPVTG